MSWIIVALLVIIIILLSICIYMDIEFTDAFSSGNPSTATTTKANVTLAPLQTTAKQPITTSKPTVTTPPETAAQTTPQTPAQTTPQTPATTTPVTLPKPSGTTEKPTVTTPPETTAQTPETTTAVPETTVAPITTEAPITTATPITTETAPTLSPDAPTICIDPGHGFDDPGAMYSLDGVTYSEKDINLAISLKLKEALNALGYNVIFTHDGVTLPDSEYVTTSENKKFFYVNQRNQWIKENKAEIDLVVSIHCNANVDPLINGTRYYILPYGSSGSNNKSVPLAEAICDAVSLSLGIKVPTNKYITQDLAVLRTGIPSVLVESAFMSNQSDLAKLINEEWQTALAQGIAQGVKDYLNP